MYAVSQENLNLIPCDAAHDIQNQKVNPDPVLRFLHHMAMSCIAQHLGEYVAFIFWVASYSKASRQLKPPT